MGYGVPAAVAAKRLLPDRTVIAFAGDGDFLMTGQELATAMQYELPIIIVIAVVLARHEKRLAIEAERAFPGPLRPVRTRHRR